MRFLEANDVTLILSRSVLVILAGLEPAVKILILKLWEATVDDQDHDWMVPLIRCRSERH